MSRFGDTYDCSIAEANLYQGRLAQALRGKRGQAVLRRLERALLELPEKRLIAGWTHESAVRTDANGDLVSAPGAVCTLGALGWWNLREGGCDAERAFLELPELETDFETADWASATFDMAWTLAWEIAFQNDEICHSETPEERYEYMLRWVRGRIGGPSHV